MQPQQADESIPMEQPVAGSSRSIITGDEEHEQDIIIIQDQSAPKVHEDDQQSLPPAYSDATASKPRKARQRTHQYPPSRSRTTLSEMRRSRSSFRHALFLLMERPTSSSSAFTLHLTTNAIIVLSAILTILETLPFFHAVNSSIWFGLETVIVALFTVEYVARSFAWGFGEGNGGWKRWSKWVTSFFALVDLFAILPYYIELLLQADTTAFFRFSILRVFRLFRVFRPFRYSSTILLTIEVMILATKRSQHALLALAFFVTMTLVVFSTLLYFIERGTWDDSLEAFVDAEGVKTQFDSIPMAAWFVLVTITTVGYGQTVPRTFFGRLITVPLLLFGLLLVALPSFVLGREFAVVWEEMSAGVLDASVLAIGREPDSPLTPYTGRGAESYDVESFHDKPEEQHEDETDPTTPLTGRRRRDKGKGRATDMLFDAGGVESDIQHHDSEERQREHDEERAVPRPKPAGVAALQKRRHRVDSDATNRTNVFMGLSHRRNGSQVNLSSPSAGGISSAIDAHTQVLSGIVKELKAERDAVRGERDALRAEREALRLEREALGRERADLAAAKERLRARFGNLEQQMQQMR